jgi:hypothetical protein
MAIAKLEPIAKILFRDPAHAKTALVVLAMLMEIFGVSLVLFEKFLS